MVIFIGDRLNDKANTSFDAVFSPLLRTRVVDEPDDEGDLGPGGNEYAAWLGLALSSKVQAYRSETRRSQGAQVVTSRIASLIMVNSKLALKAGL
jgi:hypothetical protein